MNSRQDNFIRNVMAHADKQVEMYSQAFTLRQDYQENYKAGVVNDITTPAMQAEILEAFGIQTSKLQAYINQNCTEFIDYWTNQPVITREYGKNARAIMNNTNE